VVDSKFDVEQREITDLETSSTFNSVRCLKGSKRRLGGGLVIKGKEWVENSEQHPHSDGQHGGSVYLVKWGSSGSKQTNMEICY